LDTEPTIIAQVGIVYNTLERSDQKELLLHMVERVIIDPEGIIRLELRTPFAYLQDISDKVCAGMGRVLNWAQKEKPIATMLSA